VVEVPDRTEGEGATGVPGLLALVGAVGPLLYVLLVTVLGLLWEGYDPVRDSMSELGSVESPYGPLMNVAGFMALGLSILAFAAAYQLLLPRGPWKAVATGLLVVAGVFMVVVGSSRATPAAWT
jgi:hypothetical membrane protein